MTLTIHRPAPRGRLPGTLLASKPSQTIRMQRRDCTETREECTTPLRTIFQLMPGTIAGRNAITESGDAAMSFRPLWTGAAGSGSRFTGAFCSLAQQPCNGFLQQWHFAGTAAAPQFTLPTAGAMITPRQNAKANNTLQTFAGSAAFITPSDSHTAPVVQSVFSRRGEAARGRCGSLVATPHENDPP